MSNVSLATKQSYFERVKRANYRDSLRLEGFQVDGKMAASAKKAVIQKYCRKSG